jgi:hypothetical protein
MKAFALSVLFSVALFSSSADDLARFSPDFSHTTILWQAPANTMPKRFWIYQKLPPRPFSATIISNAIILASLQSKGFPKPSTNDFYITEEYPPNYPGMIPDVFSVTPKSATISYWLPNPGTNTADIPADNIVVRRAWACAAQLGVDPAQIEFKEMTSSFNQDENDNDLTNQVCGRGVFLSRKLDELLFWSDGMEDGNFDGFWMEFGSYGRIRAFSLVCRELKQVQLQSAASPPQIMACIRALKTILLPNRNESDYCVRLKNLSKARKLIITKITPYYREGAWGEMLTNDEPPQLVSPIAEIEAVADFGDSNQVVRLFAPVTVPDIRRLLK